MGGSTEVDLTQLRTVADRVMAAADALAEMAWPALDADAMRGSAVGTVAAPDLIAARLADVVANMRGWAVAAHLSAEAFAQSDMRHAGRFRRP
jgi:hypothetical protein